ncbi:tyrosine-protein kinase STYK1-like [Synchiropus picturatus]
MTSTNSTDDDACASDDRLCIARTHQLDVIIVPVILLFGSLVTLMTICLMKYCPGQRSTTRTAVPYPHNTAHNRQAEGHRHRHTEGHRDHQRDHHRDNHRDHHREHHRDHHRDNYRDHHRDHHRDHQIDHHRDNHRHKDHHRHRDNHRQRHPLHGIDAPPGINPMEYEEIQMSVHENFSTTPQTSSPRLHEGFSRITALPLTFAMKPHDMSTIYRARMDNKNVILRVLKDSANNQDKHYFLGFASFLSGLGPHPFIPAVLGVVSVQHPIMLVLEELQHRDLLGFLWSCRQNNFSNFTEKRLFIMAGQVASALEYLHSQGCIHGNLGARSVLIGADLSAKLWGLSPAYHRKTRTPLPRGVEELDMRKWQAPEVLARQAVSQSSDVWSFGILLYEMITLGDPPFHDVTVTELLQHLQRGKHLKRPANCSNSLYAIIRLCCQFSTQQRPSVLSLLQKFQAGERSANGRKVITTSQPIDTERYLREAGFGASFSFAEV